MAIGLWCSVIFLGTYTKTALSNFMSLISYYIESSSVKWKQTETLTRSNFPTYIICIPIKVVETQQTGMRVEQKSCNLFCQRDLVAFWFSVNYVTIFCSYTVEMWSFLSQSCIPGRFISRPRNTVCALMQYKIQADIAQRKMNMLTIVKLWSSYKLRDKRYTIFVKLFEILFLAENIFLKY